MLKKIKEIGFLLTFLFFLYLLNPFELNIYIGYLLFGLIILKRNFLVENFDSMGLLLLVFSVTYALFFSFDPIAGKQYIIIYAIVPVTFYLMGKLFISVFGANEGSTILMLLITTIIFSTTGIFSVTTALGQSGFSEVERNLPNFWTGNTVTATKMGAYFTLNMCIPALLVPPNKNLNIILRGLLIAVFAITIMCVLRIGSRTQLGVFMITLLISLIYVMPKQSFRRNFLMFSMFLLMVFWVVTTIEFDFDQDWLSAFAGRMEDNAVADLASGGGRTERWIKSIEYLFEKPLGWSEHEFGHAHNFWFDVLRIGGFISFFLLIIFTVKTLILIRAFIRKNKSILALNHQLIIYTLAFNMVFMVEPILEGAFDFFVVFCFFIGVVSKYKTT